MGTAVQTTECETRLIEDAREGCEESFRQLVQSHHKVVRFYVARFIYCPASIDDIAQEVFLQAFRDLNRFRGDASFSTWIIGIARLKSLEYLRAKRKTDSVMRDLQLANQTEMQLENLQHAFYGFDAAEDRLQALTTCVAELPEHSLNIVRYFYFDQMSCATIAKTCQSKGSTIRMRLHRVRELLKNCVESKTGRFGNLGE